MSDTGVPPGWHPDPADPTGSVRWWDGNQWTEMTQPSGRSGAAYPPMATGSVISRGRGFRGGGSFASRNQRSLTAIGVAIVYVLIAVFAHFVFIGIVPVLAAVRAVQRREPLAPFAVIAAVVAVVVSITAFAH